MIGIILFNAGCSRFESATRSNSQARGASICSQALLQVSSSFIHFHQYTYIHPHDKDDTSEI